MVSWNMCASWVTTPTASCSESWVTSRRSVPPIRTAPAGRVIQPGDQVGDRRLARAGRPDQRGQLPGRGAEAHVAQHVLAGVGPLGHRAARWTPARPARPRWRGRVPERHVVELDLGRRVAGRRPGLAASRSARASGRSSMSGRRSSTSKTRSKLTSAVMTSTWTLDSAVIGPYSRPSSSGQRDQRAELEGAVDDQAAADPVDRGGGQRGQQGQRDEQRAAVHGGDHADVADPRGPAGEHLGLLARAAEQLDQHRAGHVEALGHGGAHLGVQLHRLPGQPLQPAAHVAGPGR